ncbi:MAG: zinc ribbon domain-containing protein [Lachnospiraceae bacterium]|nr:zinc ribbon domain-containing protein [Lachnospiraceae bacterium]
MFCPFCGAPNEEGARFCVSCGATQPEETKKTAAPGRVLKSLGSMEQAGYLGICSSAALMILSVFLPFFGAKLGVFGSVSLNYLGGSAAEESLRGSVSDGIIFLILGIILLLMTSLHLFVVRMGGPTLILAILTGALGIILPLISHGNLKRLAKSEGVEDFIFFGVGFWFILLAAVAMLVCAVLTIRAIMKKPFDQ